MTSWTLTTWIIVLLILVTAYLLGSIPSAVWIGKKYYGIDIREHGSKNAGTTNMLRVLGKRAAAPVFVIDFLKGYIAVLLTGLAPVTTEWEINLRLMATVAVVLGHIFPIFADFKGGKGVLVTATMALILTPAVFGILIIVFIAIVAISGFVSLGSITVAALFPIAEEEEAVK